MSRPNWLEDRTSQVENPKWAQFVGSDLLDDIVFDHPDPWPHGPLMGSGKKTLTKGDDSLSATYCTLSGHRFVRATLTLPIKGTPATLTYDTWASVSEETWAKLLAARTGGAAFEGAFAWSGNLLPNLTTEPLACSLLPGAPGQPPRLLAQDGPVRDAQEQGLALDTLETITAFD